MALAIPVFYLQPSRRGLGILLAGFMLLSASMAAACPLDLPAMRVAVNGGVLNLEIAATPEARRCGLSSRSGLPPDGGMLFVLPKTMPFAVWMKNTRIPLSIAFIDAAGRITAIEQMVPQRPDVIYDSKQPVRYAVEVNQGWFDKHGVHAGDIISLSLPAGLRAR